MCQQFASIRPCTRVYVLMPGFALLKSHLIGDHVMGLRGTSSGWRWLVTWWLLITGILISWASFSGT